jgi:polyphosphate kinase 2 (PPK2 family)
VILKFFLNVSKGEQRRRFLERINDPKKHWKFSDTDIKERDCWDDYMKAYEDCLEATSTDEAPWFIIPADYKWVSRGLVAKIVTTTIQGLELKYPEVTKDKLEKITAARQKLEAEEE